MTYERYQVRLQAIKQHQRLAAIHDPTGKMFNVGPVIITEEGIVKPAPKPDGEKEPDPLDPANMDDERKALMQQLGLRFPVPGQKLSNKMKERFQKYMPRPVPPKPVRPEGIALPEGEEDWLALWDITDEQIKSRLSSAKSKRTATRRLESMKKKEEGEFRRAMKLMKKQALAECRDWDPEAAKKKILKGRFKDEMTSESEQASSDDDSSDDEAEESSKKGKKNAKDQDSDTSSSSSSESESESDSSSESEDEQPSKESDVLGKLEASLTNASIGIDNPHPLGSIHGLSKSDKKSKKRPASDSPEDQRKAKKAKHSDSSKKDKKSKSKPEAPPTEITADQARQQQIDAAAALQAKRLERRAARKEARRLKREEEEEAERLNPTKKTKKRLRNEMLGGTNRKGGKKGKDAEGEGENGVAEGHVDTNTAIAPVTAEQWNRDALEGDEARKGKFMKLLGAEKDGVTEAAETEGKKHKEKKKHKKERKCKGEDIAKVQGELEKQFEAGMKQRVEGGGKKGLGA